MENDQNLDQDKEDKNKNEIPVEIISLVFLGTYFAAIITTFILAWNFLGGFSLYFLLPVLIFPIGVLFLSHIFGELNILIGYIIYIVVYYLAIDNRNKKVFYFLLALWIILLSTNVASCHIMIPNISR